ncbi:helix-turn-helix domain-containing protein [Diaphorobacter ruginosibacter]|uniref:helix-turn-helix domain-containing protein n=1 Tax=Diaphorobacter ruginosibacter TaxID=1715720 RepID=UPI00334237A5
MSDQPSSGFADRLRLAMKTAGDMSQSELARAIGVRPQAIQYLLNPANQAQGSKHLVAIANALDVSPQWLAGSSAAAMLLGTLPEPHFLSSQQLVEQLAELLRDRPERELSEIAKLLHALCVAPDSEIVKRRLARKLDGDK